MGKRLLIILDTHIFVWLTEESAERIPQNMLTAIEAEPVLLDSSLRLVPLLKTIAIP
jgi:PIN domain nuclease of toxin-antitoxin system